MFGGKKGAYGVEGIIRHELQHAIQGLDDSGIGKGASWKMYESVRQDVDSMLSTAISDFRQ